MKDLVIAAVIVAVLIGGWAVFDHYSEKKIDSFSSYIEDEIIPSVEDENWDECRQLIDTLSHRWHKDKKKALFFLDTTEISEIDYSLARIEKYVDARDVSNSAGELNAMSEQLRFLHTQEKINPENIF